MRKAYSYTRMSTDVQLKGDSLRRQLELSKNYAEENNLELIDNIENIKLHDIGVSAFQSKNSTQGTLSLFLACVENGLIEPNSVLLVESLDRLSRNKIDHALSQFLSIINGGVEIVTLSDGMSYSKESINNNMGSLITSLVIMFRANEESETKSKRIKAAWNNKRKLASEEKKPLTKILPSWLKLSSDRKSFIVDEKKAEVIRQIFTLCSTTTGIYGITRYLNESKVPTFNNTKYWHSSYVNKILNNRSVIGELQSHHSLDGKRVKYGEPIVNFYPSVISVEEFNNAHVALSRRKNKPGAKGKNFTNILSGLIYCKCGEKMVLYNKGNLKSDKRLMCYSKSFKAGCTIDDWAYAEAVELLFKHLKEIDFNDILNVENKEFKLSNRIATLEEENKILADQSETLIDLSLSEHLNETHKKQLIEKLNKISAKQSINEDEIKNLKTELEEYIVSKQNFNNQNIKTIIERLNTVDYFFRASINTTLSKFIERIELRPAPAFFAPYEFTDTDKEVIEYKKTHPKLTLDQIVERETFKRLYKKMNRAMIVKYKFGATRMIQGDGLTYYNDVELRFSKNRRNKENSNQE